MDVLNAVKVLESQIKLRKSNNIETVELTNIILIFKIFLKIIFTTIRFPDNLIKYIIISQHFPNGSKYNN